MKVTRTRNILCLKKKEKGRELHLTRSSLNLHIFESASGKIRSRNAGLIGTTISGHHIEKRDTKKNHFKARIVDSKSIIGSKLISFGKCTYMR